MLRSSSVTAAVAAILFMLSPAAAADAASALAVIIKVKGSVLYQAPGAPAWTTATAGQSVLAGAQVKTDADALAMVKFVADGSMVKLKPGTLVTFQGKDARSVQLSMGAALFDVAKSRDGSSFTVNGPACVATVKGTSFWVVARSDSSSTVSVLDGTVGVKAESGESRDITRGFTAEASRAGLVVRQTRARDLPEQSQTLEFEFKDAGGKSKTVKIDATTER